MKLFLRYVFRINYCFHLKESDRYLEKPNQNKQRGFRYVILVIYFSSRKKSVTIEETVNIYNIPIIIIALI